MKIRSVQLLTVTFEDGVELEVDLVPPPAPVEPAADVIVAESAKALRVREVFDYWVERTGRDVSRIRLTKERAQKIRTRLSTFTVQELKDAVDFYAEDPFHQGDNPQHQRYDDITTIFKNDDKVAKGLEAEPAQVDDGTARYRIIE